MQSTENIG